jgi:DNA-binding transcriptional regulator YdaS (Cro superfamily)
MEHPIDIAAKVVGSQKALADYLGVTKAAVGQWKEEGRRVPAEHCLRIERVTRGVVKCEELRPDMDWDVVRVPAATALADPKAEQGVAHG